MSWESLEKSAKRGPIPIGLKILGLFVLFAIIITPIGWAAGWFSEAATLAREEFGPRAMLEKYEWFKDQAPRIDKMKADIAMFESRKTGVTEKYAGYGEKMSEWPPHIQAEFNREASQARDDLIAIVSQHNTLVREYVTQSSKFNWALFRTRTDMPPETYEEYLIK